jgi:hypothetical protein
LVKVLSIFVNFLEFELYLINYFVISFIHELLLASMDYEEAINRKVYLQGSVEDKFI